MSEPIGPFPMDIVTDEAALDGTLTIYCEQSGGAARLRQLRDDILETWPQAVYQRGDTRQNVPDNPQPA